MAIAMADRETARNRLLADVLETLDRQGLRLCVLRDLGGDAHARLQEVDLLVDGRDLGRFAHAVAGAGFVALPSWGHAGHRFYMAFEESEGGWLKLDVVTRQRYGGRTRPYATRVLAGALERRRPGPGGWRPAVADGILGLVLHGVLDKRRFKEEHRRELRSRRQEIELDPDLREEVAARFAAALGPALSWSETSSAIAGEDWGTLLARRPRLARELVQRDPLGCAGRWLSGQAARVLRPFAVAAGGRGLAIALLGPDGAGKTTLARALVEDPQIRARRVYMGTNPRAATVGLPFTSWLAARRAASGPERGGTGGALAAMRYLNRVAEQAWRSVFALGLKLRGRFVLFDRHPWEAAASAPGIGANLRRQVLRQVCLRPDLVLVLNAPLETLRGRKSENPPEALEKQRRHYDALARSLPGCRKLDASASREEVLRHATSAIWRRYARDVQRS